MERVAAVHRKLIDIKPSVFDALSLEASRQGMSLKRFIETILERSCPRREIPGSSGISRLIGSALPKGRDLSSIDDDRFQYLISK